MGARARLFPEKGESRRTFLFIFSGEYFLVLLLLQHTHTLARRRWTRRGVGGRQNQRERESTKERDGECY